MIRVTTGPRSPRHQYLSLLVSFVLGLLASSACQDDDSSEANDHTPFLMRAKLSSSQKVMEGLVSENLNLIRQGAQEMEKMSQATQWPQSQDQVYDHYSKSFQNQCRQLAELAGQGDLQYAHYTYLQMTTTCINCHNYVRGHFQVQRNNDPHGPIQLIPTEWDGPTFRNRIPKNDDPDTVSGDDP